MASTMKIACPQCHKEARAPENVFGKKVRCKFCQAVFVAHPGKGQAPPNNAAKPAAKPTAPDDDDDPNPYGLVDISFAARCPNCANEMEDEEAIICLVCGYNTRSRQQYKMTKIYDTTKVEHAAWLFPGIICVLVILATIGFDIWYLMNINDMVDENTWYSSMWAHHGIKTWVVIMSLFIIFYSGRFAIKRLILHFWPPEVEKVK
jgi:hypothetical protein